MSIVKQFDTPEQSLGDLSLEAAAVLIATAADIALVVDPDGVVRDLALGSKDLMAEGCSEWVGQPWIDTVTIESRPKVEALLREATGQAPTARRHINHPSATGSDVPVLYSTVRIGPAGGAVAVGRDLRAIAKLQQQLVEAQQSMERDYWRLRHAETRYRLLFQMAREAVLIVDAAGQRVIEANPAAAALLGEDEPRIVGRALAECFAPASAQPLEGLLAGARNTGQGSDLEVRTALGGREILVSASLFRQEGSSLFLVRLSAPDAGHAPAAPAKAQARLLRVLESAPDALVVTDPHGRVLTANSAFVDLAQLASADLARGELLDRWLGRPGVDLNVLLANLRQHGTVRLFATTLRGEHGLSAEVEISGVAVPGEEPCLGFTIRNVGRRLTGERRAPLEQPRSVEQLTELVGRMPLKDLVREATDLIEKLCIEAALELTRDNRASAAEMLGLSRQSLYVKLRRYGISDFSADNDD